MYNTGDIGYLGKDGSIHHLGRSDDQVKVKVSFDPYWLLVVVVSDIQDGS
jgi:hypothetical protein